MKHSYIFAEGKWKATGVYIDPMPDHKDFTHWTSENPALGKLIGKFMVIGDTILSSYTSENGLYPGPKAYLKSARISI